MKKRRLTSFFFLIPCRRDVTNAVEAITRQPDMMWQQYNAPAIIYLLETTKRWETWIEYILSLLLDPPNSLLSLIHLCCHSQTYEIHEWEDIISWLISMFFPLIIGVSVSRRILSEFLNSALSQLVLEHTPSTLKRLCPNVHRISAKLYLHHYSFSFKHPIIWKRWQNLWLVMFVFQYFVLRFRIFLNCKLSSSAFLFHINYGFR